MRYLRDEGQRIKRQLTLREVMASGITLLLDADN